MRSTPEAYELINHGILSRLVAHHKLMVRLFADDTTHTCHSAWRHVVGTDKGASSHCLPLIILEDAMQGPGGRRGHQQS